LHLNSLRFQPVGFSLLLDTLESSPHLTSFSYDLDWTQDYASLFDKLATLGHLSSLKFNIRGCNLASSKPHKCFRSLGESLHKIKALNGLQLSLASTPESSIFLVNLSLLSQLQQFSFEMDSPNLSDQTVNLLTELLYSFAHLKSFKFTIYLALGNKPGRSSRLPDLFRGVGSLKFLKTLELTLKLSDKYMDDKTYLVLFDALASLTELTQFKLEGPRNCINDKGVIKLANSLSKLVNLEKIGIDISPGLKIENETFIELLNSFSNLKRLRRIDLRIFCSGLDLATSQTVILLLNKLRNLLFFKFAVQVPFKAPNMMPKFEDFLLDQKQYQNMCAFSFD